MTSRPTLATELVIQWPELHQAYQDHFYRPTRSATIGKPEWLIREGVMSSPSWLLGIVAGFALVLYGDVSFAQISDGTSNTIIFPEGPAVGVPGPIVGAGLPGLVLFGAYWIGRKIWNRRAD